MKNYKFIFIFSFLYLFVIILSKNIPLFWTMGCIGVFANSIYESDFTFFVLKDADPGVPPLYSFYLAILWKIFERSLFITHIAILPFIIGIFVQLKNISKKIFPEINIFWLYILVFLEPTFCTQAILGAYDFSVCFFMLYAINCLTANKKNIFFYLSLSALTLLNQRGFMLVFVFFLMDIYYLRIVRKENLSIKNILNILLPYFASSVVFGIWLFYHHYMLGWYIVADTFKDFHKFNNAEMLARNFIYIFWKIFDFGRFVIWIPLILYIIMQFAKKKLFKQENESLMILIFSMLYYFIFLYPTHYPVSHRYFLCSYVLAYLVFLIIIEKYINKKLKNIFLVFLCFILFSGNFIVYPERFGNGWDSSLKVLPYFKIEKELHNYITDKNIEPASIGAEYPMNFDRYNTYLSEEHFQFTDLDKKKINEYLYIVQSNISNTFTPEEIDNLNKRWTLEKEFYSWPVYIKLFRNPYYNNR